MQYKMIDCPSFTSGQRLRKRRSPSSTVGIACSRTEKWSIGPDQKTLSIVDHTLMTSPTSRTLLETKISITQPLAADTAGAEVEEEDMAVRKAVVVADTEDQKEGDPATRRLDADLYLRAFVPNSTPSCLLDEAAAQAVVWRRWRRRRRVWRRRWLRGATEGTWLMVSLRAAGNDSHP